MNYEIPTHCPFCNNPLSLIDVLGPGDVLRCMQCITYGFHKFQINFIPSTKIPTNIYLSNENDLRINLDILNKKSIISILKPYHTNMYGPKLIATLDSLLKINLNSKDDINKTLKLISVFL